MQDENKPLEAVSVNKPEVGLVTPDQLCYMWPGVLEIMYEKGQKWLEVVNEDDVYALLASGQAELWCAMHNNELEGFMVCMMERHGRASYYHVAYLGGKNLAKYLEDGLRKLEQYSSLMGAKEVVFDGRRGFARLLKPYGYISNTVRMRKNVRILWSN